MSDNYLKKILKSPINVLARKKNKYIKTGKQVKLHNNIIN